jgi:hypothetical protein
LSEGAKEHGEDVETLSGEEEQAHQQRLWIVDTRLVNALQ